MSDAYTIGNVTITPTGGGFYSLSHPKLGEPEQARGKEKAEQRASELNVLFPNAAEDDGVMPPQGDLPKAPPPIQIDPDKPIAEQILHARADDKSAELSAKDDEIARLHAHIESLRAAGVRTVAPNLGAGDDNLPPLNTVPASVPRRYESTLDREAREKLEKIGVKMTDIILQDSDDIPPTGLFVGHNGKGYMILPGVPVTVPDFLLGVLDDAVTSTPIVDSSTNRITGHRNRMKHPYRKV